MPLARTRTRNNICIYIYPQQIPQLDTILKHSPLPARISFQASVDDNDSIGKNSLYHEPFNVNMYTSGVNGYAAVNDLQCNMTPDYTGVYAKWLEPQRPQMPPPQPGTQFPWLAHFRCEP